MAERVMIRTREDVLTDGMRRFTAAAAFPPDGIIGGSNGKGRGMTDAAAIAGG
jgi:hypothetical protein